MGEFEDTTTLILGNEQGLIPTSIRQLSVALDRVFQEKEKVELQRHTAVMEAIFENKSHVDKKFTSLRLVLFFSENPKVFKFIATLLVLVFVLAGVGSKELFIQLLKII